MLDLIIKESELYDENTSEFYTVGPFVITIEHSLFAISKWEAKTKKVFLTKDSKTEAEIMDYLKMMTINDVPQEAYLFVTREHLDKVITYMKDEQSATWFAENKNKPPSREVITSELVYYWMSAAQIDWQAQYWHINRLFNVLQIASIKNDPKKNKKRNINDLYSRNYALNEKRLAEMKNNMG